MLALDHLAVLGESLEEATLHVEAALGQPMQPGGQHGDFGTHNRLLGLEPDLYIEAIAVDPAAPPPGRARWFGLDRFSGAPRLDKWVLRTADLAAAQRALPMAGERVELSRGALSWAMTVPTDGALPFDGLFPALIQWHAVVPPGRSLRNPSARLVRLVLRHPQAPALQAMLAPHLDAPAVVFEIGPAGLEAEIETPGGTVTLS
jgi:hypothetical protein